MFKPTMTEGRHQRGWEAPLVAARHLWQWPCLILSARLAGPPFLPSGSPLGGTWSSWAVHRRRTAVTYWDSSHLPSYPPFSHQSCFSILNSWQSRNKSQMKSHTSSQCVLVGLGLEEKEEEEQLKWEGKAGRKGVFGGKGQPSSESSRWWRGRHWAAICP